MIVRQRRAPSNRCADIAFDFVALRAVVRSHDASEVMIHYTIAAVRCIKASILQG
jgi:hypothetical protein